MSTDSTTTDLTMSERITEAASKVLRRFDSGNEEASTLLHASMQMTQAVNNYEAALKTINERSEGWKFDWSSVGEVMAAEAALKFWHEVVATSSPSKDELVITLDGLSKVLKIKVRALLNNYGGQSTSLISNEETRLEKELTSRLVNHFSGLIGLDKELAY